MAGIKQLRNLLCPFIKSVIRVQIELRIDVAVAFTQHLRLGASYGGVECHQLSVDVAPRSRCTGIHSR